jgi:hypothetical protein
VVATCVKLLESYMDFCPTAGSTFRELDGLRQMINRLAYEVRCNPGIIRKECEEWLITGAGIRGEM